MTRTARHLAALAGVFVAVALLTGCEPQDCSRPGDVKSNQGHSYTCTQAPDRPAPQWQRVR